MKYSLGLDIGNHSIKLLELGIDGKKASLVAAGSVPTPPSSLHSTVPADAEALGQIITKLVHDAGVKSQEVRIALPESQVFTRVIEVPSLSERELASAIQWEAEQYIPLPLDQVNLDYSILEDAKGTGTNKMSVLLVAAPKNLVERYLSLCELADLTPISAETEIIATIRAINPSITAIKSVMLLTFGGQTSDIAIVRNGKLMFTRSFPVGGDGLTRSLSEGLDLSMVQAEEYKKTYGVLADRLEGKILATFQPLLTTIVTELKRALAYYTERHPEEKVQTLLLSGGTARLPGMVPYFATTVGLEVQLANPWVGITKDARFAVLTPEGPTFCVAAGLALRGLTE